VFVGFKKPINVNIRAGGIGTWKYVEDQSKGGDSEGQDVISLFLEEDRVVGLHSNCC
jgi:hypothetical protein